MNPIKRAFRYACISVLMLILMPAVPSSATNGKQTESTLTTDSWFSDIPPTPYSEPANQEGATFTSQSHGATTSQLIVNQGFEWGPSSPPWSLLNGAAITTASRSWGNYGVDLCGYNGCSEAVRQAIAVPHYITSATIAYHFYMNTYETDNFGCYDGLAVGLTDINASNGVGAVHCQDWAASGGWHHLSQDVTSWLQSQSGKWIYASADGVTDSSLPTQIYFDEFTLTITVSPPPSVPRNVVAKATENGAYISWTPPESDGGSPITSYTVTRNPGEVFVANTTRTDWGVDGLVSGTVYDFKVYATNSAGNSPSATSNQVRPTPFWDVPIGDWGNPHVNSIYWAGITSGCAFNSTWNLRTYCPNSSVTRAEMAVFLLRAAGHASDLPTTHQGIFADVGPGDWFAPYVEHLYEHGLTTGCGTEPLRFCPNGTVSRAEMAVFLLNGLSFSSEAPHNSGDHFSPYAGTFTDVSESAWFALPVEHLSDHGITTGCSAGLFCPTLPVSRREMAVFLKRTWDLP